MRIWRRGTFSHRAVYSISIFGYTYFLFNPYLQPCNVASLSLVNLGMLLGSFQDRPTLYIRLMFLFLLPASFVPDVWFGS